MSRLLPIATIIMMAITSPQARAQITQVDGAPPQALHSAPLHDSGYNDGYDGHIYHDYWHHPPHTPSVTQLDTYADQLAKVARHLHEDAHRLSQDYEHSESIERYVDQIDRLQQHMHQILHEAAEANRTSTGLIQHIKSDVRQVKSLLNQLYRELQHQGFDGARTNDFHAMAHMRQVVVSEANPLIRQLEVALYGYTQPQDVHRSFRHPVPSPWYPHSRNPHSRNPHSGIPHSEIHHHH
ncbi:hypothetical protein Pla52o_55290 [Novipirellula galeiformis]|uniref:Uncharacterized protein n=1 Tax=Novipirellula galeiformis TaxID=2528004 RepID=A0A5C6BT64_9BACT|nr:hypothetical protein [Novipirellula galeiformis]TWU14992.1 hypothetical protein Pla52o_55290 [Novipirellula galeiformis]